MTQRGDERTLGELFAWMIGWDLILEYAVGSMTVAVGWSGYFQRILLGFGVELPLWMTASPWATEGAVINLPAAIIVLFITGLLVVGVREHWKVVQRYGEPVAAFAVSAKAHVSGYGGNACCCF